MTDDLVGLLRERMAAASEQPWVYRPEHYDDWGWIRGAERDSDIGRYRPIVANAKNSDIDFDDMQSFRDAGTDPYGPNALLIVDAVNALPTLLARIEALEAEIAKAPGRIDQAFEMGWRMATCSRDRNSFDEMKQAIADYRTAISYDAPHAD